MDKRKQWNIIFKQLWNIVKRRCVYKGQSDERDFHDKHKVVLRIQSISVESYENYDNTV